MSFYAIKTSATNHPLELMVFSANSTLFEWWSPIIPTNSLSISIVKDRSLIVLFDCRIRSIEIERDIIRLLSCSKGCDNNHHHHRWQDVEGMLKGCWAPKNIYFIWLLMLTLSSIGNSNMCLNVFELRKWRECNFTSNETLITLQRNRWNLHKWGGKEDCWMDDDH